MARVVRFARSLRADIWGDPRPRWSQRPQLRPDELSVRRLEPRRVLAASIQTLAVPAEAVEGDTVEVSAEATGGGALQFDWTITRNSNVIAQGSGQDFTFQPQDDGEYDVALRVTDASDASQAYAEGTVTVANAKPFISQLSATPIPVSGVTTLTGVLSDPGGDDTHTLQINWGDPSDPANSQTIDLSSPPPGVDYNPATGAFSIDHQYANGQPAGVLRINVKATDDDGGEFYALASGVAGNSAPEFSGLSATPITENGVTLLTGVVTDPDPEDLLTLQINWGHPESPNNAQLIDLADPPPGVSYDPTTGSFSVEHQYLDNPASGVFRINVKATDGTGGEFNALTAGRVENAPPTLSGLTATSIDENGVTVLAGVLDDPGTLDTHRLEIDWGDPLSPGNTQLIDLENPPLGVHYDPTTGVFTVEHQYLDDNPSITPVDVTTISVKAVDNDGASVVADASVQISNVAPGVEELAATSLQENGYTTLTGRVVDPGSQDTHRLVITWGDPASPGHLQVINLASPPPGVDYNPADGGFRITHQYLDDNPSGTGWDAYSIRVNVLDDDGGTSFATTTVVVTNVPPALAEINAHDVDENGVTTLSGKIVDPGTLDTFTLTVDWGDGATEQYTTDPDGEGVSLLEPTGGVSYDPTTREFSIKHRYLDDNPSGTPTDAYTISVDVLDDDGGAAQATTDITVRNVAPSLVGVDANNVSENGVTTLTGKIVDPGTLDTFTLTVNWDDGTVEEFTTDPGGTGISLLDPPDGVTYDAGTREFTIQHRYLDDDPTGTPSDPYTIRLTLVDDDADMAVDAKTITVANAAPVIGDTPDVNVDEGQQLFIGPHAGGAGVMIPGIMFEDAGTLDTHTATINWGDGSMGEDLVVLQNDGSEIRTGILIGSHTYADNGAYTVTVTITDDDGGQDVETFVVNVINVDPTLTGVEGLQVDEGQAVTLAGLGVGLADPGFDNPLNTGDPSNGGELQETFVGMQVDWGDGSAPMSVSIVDRVSGSPGVPTTAAFSHDVHYYADDGVYRVSVTMSDDDGGAVTRTFEILVENVAPALVLTDQMFVINEGDTLVIPHLGSFTDPGARNDLNPNGASDETFSYTIDWGDGTCEKLHLPVSVVDGGPGVGKTGNLLAGHDHTYADNDADSRYTITVTLHDDDGGYDKQSFEITVNNVNPTIEPLTPGELIDDDYMPGILVDAMDLEGDGVTYLVLRFSDPGADTYDVWIDWGDKLYLPEGDQRFVKATPINWSESTDGVTLLFSYPYTGPPDPLNPAAPIEITAIVVDDDYAAATGDELVFGPETTFLIEPGRSDPGQAVITNPGIEDTNVAIDTTPDIALLEFPQLAEYIEPPAPQVSVDLNQQTQDVEASAGELSATSERVWVIRTVAPDGELGEPVRLKPDALDRLPELFAKLPDGHYQILVIRTENNTSRLVMDFVIRGGRPIDVTDDSDGARDRPPTEEQVDPPAESVQAPIEIDAREVPAEIVDPQQNGQTQPPGEPTVLTGQRRQSEAQLTAGAAVAFGLARTRQGEWRRRVEDALQHADEEDWKLLNLLRRRPR
ncbi:PKD domain protein [Posidoniimonas corsicana]|uniref:PKD domain protein n=2 Tax=Posidoniimonas corsicana TaxID=1938618 RepID=A0A5C5UUX0_9BACT|nr:PKD domain protein [Posidoniimonas corsicana]